MKIFIVREAYDRSEWFAALYEMLKILPFTPAIYLLSSTKDPWKAIEDSEKH